MNMQIDDDPLAKFRGKLDKFCEGCGQQKLGLWKHCPLCGFRVSTLKGNPDSATSIKRLFSTTAEFAEDLMASDLADIKLSKPDKDWDEDLKQQFVSGKLQVLYVNKVDQNPDNAEFALTLVFTDLTLKQALEEEFSDLESTQTRLLDDGWYIEVAHLEDNIAAELKYAKKLQAEYGGEIQVVKP